MNFPEPVIKKLFGEEVPVYMDTVIIQAMVKVPENQKEINCVLKYQACNSSMCKPPQEIKLLCALKN